MKRFWITAILCCLISFSSLYANDKNSWKPLFGKNLSNALYDADVWTVTGGVLNAMEDNCIWTNEEYENFELDLEFKNDKGSNSGVIVYCTDINDWIPNSVEIQIADDYYEPWAEAKPTDRCGAVYGHLGPNQLNVVKKAGEWNHMRIRCTRQRITVILNGKKITEMDMSLWTSGTINPDGSEIPSWLPTPFAELPTKGFIGLQGKHGDATIWFRNIKIRNVQEKQKGTENPVLKKERDDKVFPEY